MTETPTQTEAEELYSITIWYRYCGDEYPSLYDSEGRLPRPDLRVGADEARVVKSASVWHAVDELVDDLMDGMRSGITLMGVDITHDDVASVWTSQVAVFHNADRDETFHYQITAWMGDHIND